MALLFVSCGKDDDTTTTGQGGTTPEMPTTYDITYTYNGDNTGTLAINGGQPFVIDPYNRTMTTTLTFNAEFESGVTSSLGGETVLHQMR